MVPAICQARPRVPSVGITAPGTEFSRPETRLRIRHTPPAGDRMAKITRRIGRANAACSHKVSVTRDLGGRRGGPGRSRNFSYRQSFTTRWVHIRLFEPQWLFWPLDAPCCEGGACVSPKPKARAQVYCSTRCRTRGWRKDPTEGPKNNRRNQWFAEGQFCTNGRWFARNYFPICKPLGPIKTPARRAEEYSWQQRLALARFAARRRHEIVRAEIGATVAVLPIEGGAV